MIKCEKIFPSIYKETQGMQCLDYSPLHKDALPTQNHQRNKKWSQFPLPYRKTTQKCTCDNRRSFSKHLFDGDNHHSLQLFYHFIILRPSRRPFGDVTLYCKAAVSIELLIDIITLVLKYIYKYHLIQNIFLELTRKHICPY